MINHRDEEDVLRLCPLVGATSELVGGAVEYRGERKSEKDDRKESVTFEPGDYPKPTRTTVASAVGPHQSARTNATREAGREERRLARRRVRTVICSVLAAAMLLAVALRGGLPPDGDIRSHPLPLQLEKEHDALDWGALHGQRILKKKTKEVHHHHHHVAKKVENGKNKSASSAAVAAARDVGPNREGDALLDSSAKFATVEEEGEEESSLKHSRRAKTKLYSGSHDHLAKDQSSDGSGDYSKYSCDSLYRRTDPSIPGMRCDFAKTCNGGEGIYAPVTFCSDQYSPRTVILLLALPLCLLLVILFRILGSTAEEFFSPGLEMFSLRMGLPERFAGVTLLALGNGAPDVASTVNAILDDPNNGYLLAMGELTGAAMVIGTVVAGAVAWVAPGGHGVQFGGAFVRDVLVFVLTMGVTYKCLEDRSVTRTEVWVFMGVYAGYVLVVLAADLYHRNVVEPRDREERRKMRREAKKANNEAKIIAEAYLATDAADDKAEPTAATTAKGIAELAPASETTGLLSDREHPKNKKPAVITHLVRDRGISLGSYELAKASQRKEGVGGVSGGGHKLEKVIEAFSNYDERSRDDDDVDDEDTGTDCEEGSERTSLNGAYHGLGADGNIYRAVGENNIERAGDEAAVTVPIKSGDKVGYTASSLHSSPRPTAPPPFEKSHSLCSSIENHQIAATSSGWPRRVASDGTEPLVVFHPHRYHPHHGGVMDIAHPLPHMCHHPSFDEHSVGGASTITHDGMAQHPCAGEGARSWPDAFWGCRSEFAAHWAEFWREMYGPPHVCSDFGDGCEQREGKYESEGKDNKGEFSDGVGNDNGWLDKFLLTCELPFTVLRKLTIPIPCDGYYSRPLVALSAAFSPLWLVFYLRQQFDVDLLDVPPPGIADNGRGTKLCTVILVFLLPFSVGMLVARYAPSGDVPMRTSVSVPITLWGFLVSATWLDLIADQLVGLLSYFGIVCHIPSTIMGLTVLAWGNSLQDMLANITVARKGLSIMAITACFAGPIFNMLVGLGIGFAALLNMTGRTSIPVELTPPLRMGFFFSILNGAVVIVTGVALGQRTIPKQYGIVAIVLYAAYAITSLVL